MANESTSDGKCVSKKHVTLPLTNYTGLKNVPNNSTIESPPPYYTTFWTIHTDIDRF
jgi:hypothetical protein